MDSQVGIAPNGTVQGHARRRWRAANLAGWRSRPGPAILAAVLAAILASGGSSGSAAGGTALDRAPALAAGELLAAAQPTAAAGPLAGIVIAIDPGHNGGNAAHARQISRQIWIGTRWRPCNMVGTTTTAGYPEHRFNYLVARRVKARLEALGATVYLTRNSDTGVGPCVDARAKLGARVHASLTISIHADGAPSVDRGFIVMKPGLVRGYTDDIVTSSARLAVWVRWGLIHAGLPVANYYARNGIIARRDLGTLNFSDVPIVEVELGNMKNRGDAARMTSAAGRDRYAIGLVAGIRRFLGR